MSEKLHNIDDFDIGGVEESSEYNDYPEIEDSELNNSNTSENNNSEESDGLSVSLDVRHDAMKEIIPALNRISRDRGALEHTSTEFGFQDFVDQYGSVSKANAKLDDMNNDIPIQKHKIGPELDRLMGDKEKFEKLFPEKNYADERMNLANEINDDLGYKSSDGKERGKILRKIKPWWVKRQEKLDRKRRRTEEIAEKQPVNENDSIKKIGEIINDLPISINQQETSEIQTQLSPEEVQNIQIGTSEDAIDNYRQGHRCSYDEACEQLGYDIDPKKRFPLIDKGDEVKTELTEEEQNRADADIVEKIIKGFSRPHSEQEYKNACGFIKVDFEKIKHLLDIKL